MQERVDSMISCHSKPSLTILHWKNEGPYFDRPSFLPLGLLTDIAFTASIDNQRTNPPRLRYRVTSTQQTGEILGGGSTGPRLMYGHSLIPNRHPRS